MELHHLMYFKEVAEKGGFTKASQHLHVSQPTISKMVRDLEDELGIQLFDRKGKRVVLTDAGKVLLDQANKVLDAFHNVPTELSEVIHLQKGSIRLGLPPMIGSIFFSKVIAKFHQLYPAIKIQIIEAGAKKVTESIHEGSLDLGVAILPVDISKFEVFPFFQDDLMVLTHSNHPLASREQITLSELSQESFIMLSEDFALHDIILNLCAHMGFTPDIVCKSSQWDFIGKMVSAELGISFLPETICTLLDKENIKLIPLVKPNIPWHLGLIWGKDRYLSYAAKEFIQVTQSLLPAET
ncbi:LysR family transcriptional regulator [Paenibacillus sp. N1-5-1-14]|uniref:LysR family transcriptional regulator n=1 Tax=Paenibacillus radicibacter TaxID=2972488 RepID=UPI002158D721|nr:LysR family transcriptional regulator [Paenibacillus radicibacter]MCR8641334.1 LysR family transcriptional regulator [Paenibacillus radicibacter]